MALTVKLHKYTWPRTYDVARCIEHCNTLSTTKEITAEMVQDLICFVDTWLVDEVLSEQELLIAVGMASGNKDYQRRKAAFRVFKFNLEDDEEAIVLTTKKWNPLHIVLYDPVTDVNPMTEHTRLWEDEFFTS